MPFWGIFLQCVAEQHCSGHCMHFRVQQSLLEYTGVSTMQGALLKGTVGSVCVAVQALRSTTAGAVAVDAEGISPPLRQECEFDIPFCPCIPFAAAARCHSAYAYCS